MKKCTELLKEALIEINGGSEETYDVGHKIGYFFGKIGGFIDRVTEIFK